jgi:hypothetical protein
LLLRPGEKIVVVEVRHSACPSSSREIFDIRRRPPVAIQRKGLVAARHSRRATRPTRNPSSGKRPHPAQLQVPRRTPVLGLLSPRYGPGRRRRDRQACGVQPRAPARPREQRRSSRGWGLGSVPTTTATTADATWTGFRCCASVCPHGAGLPETTALLMIQVSNR